MMMMVVMATGTRPLVVALLLRPVVRVRASGECVHRRWTGLARQQGRRWKVVVVAVIAIVC